MLNTSLFQKYYSPTDMGSGGSDSGGSSSGSSNNDTGPIVRKLFTVTDNGVGKVLADLQGKALTQNSSPIESVLPMFDPVLMNTSQFGGTYRLELHIQSPSPVLSKFVWVPLLIAGYTEEAVNGEELRLGFDSTGPYYWYTATARKYYFQITAETSSDSAYQQYCILGSNGAGDIPADILTFTSVILWIPIVQSSLVHPTEILGFTENNQRKAMTFVTGNNQPQLLTERYGYDNDVRHGMRSMIFPAFSVPLAISTINSYNQTAWNYFDWCQTSYNPTTLQELSVAHYYKIAETDGGSTYLISGVYSGVAELLDPTSYRIPLDNLLGAWIAPTSYWACAYGTVGFAPANNNVVTTDDALPQVIVHNHGAMSVPTASNYHIPNLLQGYVLVLRSDHLGYNPQWGLWKDSNVNFTSYNENGIQFTDDLMCSYALTVLVTANPQEYYNQMNTVVFQNHSSTQVTVKDPNGTVIRAFNSGSTFTYTLESTGTYTFTTGASTTSLTLTQNIDTGKVVTVLGNSGSLSVMYSYPSTDV